MAISPSQPPARVVLIACGSFNPVTNMHLRMFGKFCFDKNFC